MSSGSVLFVETSRTLREAGFEVVAGLRGPEAIGTFGREPERVVALLTDIRLGDGPSGWDVARHLRGADPTMPVI